MNKLVLNRELTDLNTYIKALNAHYHAGNAIKQQETDYVYFTAIEQKLKPITQYPVTVWFVWYSKNERKDIDNVCFAKKFILDGLVKAKILSNDSRKYVEGFRDVFCIDKKNPRVEIELLPT